MAKVLNIGFYPQTLDLCYVRSKQDISPFLPPINISFEQILACYWKVKKWRINVVGNGENDQGPFDFDYTSETLSETLPTNSEKDLVCGNIWPRPWRYVSNGDIDDVTSFWVYAAENNLGINGYPFIGATSSGLATYHPYDPQFPSDWAIVGTSTLDLGQIGGPWSWDCWGLQISTPNILSGNITITALEYWNYN